MRPTNPALTRRALIGGLATLGAGAAGAALGLPSAVASTLGPTIQPIRFDLPRPAGRYAVGSTELHLVDAARREPWSTDPTARRELMVSLWYPARPGGDWPRTPYMRPEAAMVFDTGASAILKIAPGTINWTGIGTHARTGTAVAAFGGTARRPVVLYSPGMFNERTLDTNTAVELASRGYIVVTVDHTHEAHAVAFPDGRVVQTSPALTAIGSGPERNKAALDVRVADIRFVLDQLQELADDGNPDAAHRRLPCGLGGALDLSRIGMFGHSLGGMTTAETMRQDRRVRAGANLDGPLGYDWTDPGQLLPVAREGLDRPFLQMGAWLQTQTARQPHTHAYSPSWKALWNHSTGWKRDLWTERAGHNSFTDYQAILPALDGQIALPPGLREQMIGTVAPNRFVTSRRAYITAFFDQHLRNRHQPLLDNPSPHHPDIQFID